jgi:hypothetical protein
MASKDASLSNAISRLEVVTPIMHLEQKQSSFMDSNSDAACSTNSDCHCPAHSPTPTTPPSHIYFQIHVQLFVSSDTMHSFVLVLHNYWFNSTSLKCLTFNCNSDVHSLDAGSFVLEQFGLTLFENNERQRIENLLQSAYKANAIKDMNRNLLQIKTLTQQFEHMIHRHQGESKWVAANRSTHIISGSSPAAQIINSSNDKNHTWVFENCWPAIETNRRRKRTGLKGENGLRCMFNRQYTNQKDTTSKLQKIRNRISNMTSTSVNRAFRVKKKSMKSNPVSGVWWGERKKEAAPPKKTWRDRRDTKS